MTCTSATATVKVHALICVACSVSIIGAGNKIGANCFRDCSSKVVTTSPQVDILTSSQDAKFKFINWGNFPLLMLTVEMVFQQTAYTTTLAMVPFGMISSVLFSGLMRKGKGTLVLHVLVGAYFMSAWELLLLYKDPAQIVYSPLVFFHRRWCACHTQAGTNTDVPNGRIGFLSSLVILRCQ